MSEVVVSGKISKERLKQIGVYNDFVTELSKTDSRGLDALIQNKFGSVVKSYTRILSDGRGKNKGKKVLSLYEKL
jgi:hypothetical protein